jgi:DNA helicase-2/ATP-dependent DNA helicase PcrA
MLQKKLYDDLNEIQRQAVRHNDGPLLIAAGAGSGKTRTLTSRLIYLLKSGTKPEKIIAITFTNKAANEMRNRVLTMTNDNDNNKSHSHDHLFIGTFHSLGARILKEEAKHAGRTKYFTIFDEDDSLGLIKDILKESNLSKERFNPIAIAAKISQIKNEVQRLNSAPSDFVLRQHENAHTNYDNIIAAVFEKYEATLLKNNAFDFDDLIEKVVRIFLSNKEILKKYQNRWQYILVDEFQDVNTSQYMLIKLLAQKHKNLFVIGDDQQAIYGFRFADFRNFLNFEKDWPNAAIIKLEENYRSTKNIICAASELIKNNKFQKPKTLWTKNPEGNLIKILAFQNKEEEALGIAEKILEIIRQGESLKNNAVLYRTNAQSRAIEQALIRAQIPYEIFGGLKFYARKEIKDIVAGLRYASNIKDVISSERIRKIFTSRRWAEKSESLLKELPKLAEELSIAELINFFLENTDYNAYLEKNFKNSEERRENIKELIDFAGSFKNLDEFLERISLLQSADTPRHSHSHGHNINLMTIHLAKGLEFDNIFIIGANDGLLPHERSMFDNEELEEERRLMYVAMTRAKHNLCISFYDLPSRFLGEIPPELVEFKQVTGYGEELKDWDDETIYLE